MAGFEHLIKSYDVRDLLDDIASSDPPAAVAPRAATGRVRDGTRCRGQKAAACGLLALTAAACVSTPKNSQPPPATPPPAPPPLEASYDWHGLLLVPFGTLLKEVPFTLHEVLLFRDAAHAPAADDAECYAMEQTAPRLVAHTPSEYMLCFKHDRLARVQATVNLPPGEAVKAFSDACGLWHRAEQAAPAAAAATPAVAAAARPAPGGCDGRDGAISYSGRLDQEADQADTPLTVTLDAAVQP